MPLNESLYLLLLICKAIYWTATCNRKKFCAFNYATKFFSGHSDVMGGIILTDDPQIEAALRAERFYTGAILDPHSAWLLCRSMRTFQVRMRQHEKTTAILAEFLKGLPQVRTVYLPAVDGCQLTGYGGILFLDLREDLVERYGEFARSLRLFDTGTGMACVTSMVAQPFTGSHASLSDDEKRQMDLGKSLALSIGAKPLILDPQRHDRLVAAISHLPYMLAVTLVKAAEDVASGDPMVWKLAASGFRDTSRLAAGDITMMLDILATNRTHVLEMLGQAQAHLSSLMEHLGREDLVSLRKALQSARARRAGMF